MEEKSDILVVNDGSEISNQVKAALDELGIGATYAHSEHEAVGLCSDTRYFLILAAVPNSGAVGFSTVVKIRSADKACKAPVLFIAGDESAFAKAYDYQNAECIMAPVNPKILGKKMALLKTACKDHWEMSRRIKDLKETREEMEKRVLQMRDFVSIVAHDLRAPLGKLINISEVLISGVDPEELHTFYQLLQKTSKRGFSLVNDILDLTAVESGKVQLDMQRCDIWPLAIQIISELNYLANEKNITLVNNIHDSLEVRADGRRIFQVLANLVTNAVKFTPRDGVVTLNTRVLEDGVELQVCDTGVGIPQDMISALFAKHEKVSTQGTDGERGTGFGLPLSQELIRAHGSSIEVLSEQGKGSVFKFMLPWWVDS